jgi:predicted transcriptional regulator of viral defense system
LPVTAKPADRLGPVSAQERAFLAAKERRGQRHVSEREDEALLRQHSANPYAMVHRMASKGLLIPVTSGSYIIAPATGARRLEQAAPVQLAIHARLAPYGEYFLSYFTGLIEHGLTDLDETQLYAAARGMGVRRAEVMGRPLVLTHITSERKWFGVEEVRIGQGRRTPHYYRATPERVLLDTLDRPRLCGSAQVIVRAWERAFRENVADAGAVAEDAPRMGYSVARRAGFWLAQLDKPRAAARLRNGTLGNRSVPVLVDAAKEYGDGPWPVDREWGLVLNVPARAYRGWIDYAK